VPTTGDKKAERFGILVGGGPAPGINGVIAAATIAACKEGYEVVGFLDGFKHLINGKTTELEHLDIQRVAQIFDQGGSILRTSRENPTKIPDGWSNPNVKPMDNVLGTLKELNVKYLVTIGGDDTCYSAGKTAEAAGGAVKVVHVPKTIDNDLPLDPGMPTFGYETARHFGTTVVKNLMQDARTTPRWYIVVAMGRTAGHLALGIAKAASAPLAVIPEEFGDREDVTFDEICDIVEGSILKRLAHVPTRPYGVAVLAEGLIERMTREEIIETFGAEHVEYDQHGHPRLDDLDLGPKVRDEMRKRFKARGMKKTFIAKNLGYELRCADPIPFDCEYTRNLGYAAVAALLGGIDRALITFVGGKMKPVPFADLPRNNKGRLIPRLVEMDGESYRFAREFMLRIEPKDIEPARLAALCQAGNLTEEDFRRKFAAQLVPANGRR
jgi:6-phosphofructokinase 1